MIRGCLKNVFAMVGCFTILLVAAIAAWYYRDRIDEFFHSLFAARSEVVAQAEELSNEPTTGRPSQEALRSALRKNAEMERSNGNATVVLTADELASLIVDGIAPQAQEALDSVTVTLFEDRFALSAVVLTQALAAGGLGPLAFMLAPRERIEISGSAHVRREGVADWEPDAFQFGAFPLPQTVIAPVVNQITGGTDGTFRIRIPTTVGDLRIRPSGVTFYRRDDDGA